MKRLFATLCLALAIIAAVLLWNGTRAEPAVPLPSPGCGQKPFYNTSYPGNPFFWHSGPKTTICFVLVYDKYGPFPLRENGCVMGVTGWYCATGMNVVDRQFKVSGPEDILEVALFESWPAYLPAACKGGCGEAYP